MRECQRKWTVVVAGVIASLLVGGTQTAFASPDEPTAPPAVQETAEAPSAGESPAAETTAGATTTTAPKHWNFQFSNMRAAKIAKLPVHVSLVHIPIRIWFYTDPAGSFVRVRVVGHADSYICRLATDALLNALLDPAVDGFLGYGVGELVPASDASADFDTRIRALRDELKTIFEQIDLGFIPVEEAKFLDVRDVTQNSDERFLTPPRMSDRAGVTVALADTIRDDEAPAFVPARAWINGNAEPIRLEVTAAELGLDDKLFDRLIGTASLSHTDGISQQAIHRVLMNSREATIDALLRSWPISIKTEVDARKVSNIIATKVPRVWKRLLAELALRGIDAGRGQDGSDLVGPSVFYRVTDRGHGKFTITPTYIVHGNYVERWSPDRNSVVIVRTYE